MNDQEGEESLQRDGEYSYRVGYLVVPGWISRDRTRRDNWIEEALQADTVDRVDRQNSSVGMMNVDPDLLYS